MGVYRKKPVEIEARRVANEPIDNSKELVDWCGGIEVQRSKCSGETVSQIAIETLEGTMYASVGDWIIKGVRGEFYPCKPDILKRLTSESRRIDMTLNIEERFGFHKATIEGPNATAPVHAALRREFREFAEVLNDLLPEGRTKSLAFTELETASMWAHKAIAQQAPLE